MAIRTAKLFEILGFILVAFGSIDFAAAVAQTDTDVDVVVLDAPEDHEVAIDLDEWEAPVKLQKSFPYYITGFDYKGQAVFVVEFGRWNVRKYFEDGGDEMTADMYIDQMLYRFTKAEKNFGTEFPGNGLFSLVVDFDEYDSKQMYHGPSLYFVLTIAKKFVNLGGGHMDYAVLINVNKFSNTLIHHLIGPIIGEDIFSRLIVGGMNKDVWGPMLLSRIPKEFLASWYGGSPEPFRPLAVFG